MNAQLKETEQQVEHQVVDFTPETLTAAVSKIVKSLKDKARDGDKARSDNETALAQLRALAESAHAAGKPVKATATYIQAAMLKAGIKRGTATPYATAFRGMMYALDEGKSLTEYAKKGDKLRPINASEAQALATWTEASPEERAEKEAAAARADVIAEIVKRLKAVDDLATLEAFRDTLEPVAESEGGSRTETAAEKAKRELDEAQAAAEREVFGDTADVREA